MQGWPQPSDLRVSVRRYGQSGAEPRRNLPEQDSIRSTRPRGRKVHAEPRRRGGGVLRVSAPPREQSSGIDVGGCDEAQPSGALSDLAGNSACFFGAFRGNWLGGLISSHPSQFAPIPKAPIGATPAPESPSHPMRLFAANCLAAWRNPQPRQFSRKKAQKGLSMPP